MVRRAAGENGAATQVVAANVDTVLLCDALDGDLSLRHLERFLALAWQSGATPVVLITKSDTLAPAGVAGAVEAVKAVAAGWRCCWSVPPPVKAWPGLGRTCWGADGRTAGPIRSRKIDPGQPAGRSRGPGHR